MQVIRILCLTVLVGMVGGCTTQATRQAITNFETSEDHKQVAFDNTYRIANEQMHLNLIQFINSHKNDSDAIVSAMTATWKARNQLEETRIQYMYGRSLALSTVGQYIYDQQGFLSVWFNTMAKELGLQSKAVSEANKKSGLNLLDLLPTSSTATTQPASTQSFIDILNEYKKGE